LTSPKILIHPFEELEPVYDAIVIGAVTQMLANAGVKTDTTGCIFVDAQMQTNIEGVYAAGDATCSRKYQIAVSVRQGATASLSIIRKHIETTRKK